MQIREHKSQEKPLFSFMDDSSVSRRFSSDQLNHSLSFGGLDTQLYQFHSFHIGVHVATAAADMEASDT